MDIFETGKLISQKRKQKNMTQKDMAKYLNVSDKAVSKWERGESYPEITTLPKLALLLELTIDELLLGSNSRDEAHIDNSKNELDDMNNKEEEIIHSYFLEDISYKFHKNVVITYLIICIGVFVNFTPIKVISAIFGLIGAAFYYFSVYDFNISIKRFRIHINKNKDVFKNNIFKYCNIFIGISILGLFTLSYISLNDGMFNMNNYYNSHQDSIFNISHTNSTVIMIVGILLMNLLIFNVLYNKIMKNYTLKNTKMFILLNVFGLLSGLISGILMIGYKVYRFIPDSMYGYRIKNDLLIVLILITITIVSNLLIQKIIIKEKLVNNLYFIIANILGVLIIVLGVIQNIEGSKNKGTNILAIIYSGNIYASLLFVLTIYHFTNMLILNIKKPEN